MVRQRYKEGSLQKTGTNPSSTKGCKASVRVWVMFKVLMAEDEKFDIA